MCEPRTSLSSLFVPPLFKFLLHAAAANSASVKPEGLGIAKQRVGERESSSTLADKSPLCRILWPNPTRVDTPAPLSD